MARYIDADLLKEVALGWEPPLDGKQLEYEIDTMPTADVAEVKHGEWRLHPDGSGTCNQCGRTQIAVWDFDNAQEYCGKCGARMDGGKEG